MLRESFIAALDAGSITWMEIGGGCTAFFLFLLVPYAFLWGSFKKRIQSLSHRKHTLEILLDKGGDAYCWWGKNTPSAFQITHKVIPLLGLDSKKPVFLQDVLNQFIPSDMFKLSTLVTNLEKKHIAFSVPLSLIDQKTMVCVSGSWVMQNGECLYLLSLVDITLTHLKIDKLKITLNDTTQMVEKLTTVLDQIPLPIWYRGAENKIDFCNQTYAAILGTLPQQVLEEDAELIDKQKKASPYQMAIKAQMTGQPQISQSHFIVNGHRRLMEISVIPLPDSQESIGYGLDRTEAEEAALQLTKHIRAHGEVLQHLSTPVAVYNANTRLEFFNHAYLKLFEFDEKWLCQKPTYGEVLQDLRERRKLPEYTDFSVFRNAQIHLFHTLISPFQEMMYLPDGRILRGMTVPHPLGGLLFMFDDVTDKLTLERQYNTLIAVQKETIDHLYEGILVLGSDNRLRLSNQAVFRILKINPTPLSVGCHVGDILSLIQEKLDDPLGEEAFKKHVLLLLDDRKAITDQLNLPDQVLQYSYIPLPDGSHLLSFWDVSDRWRFEQALSERNQALEQADHLKSSFISHISYELRAPLNTIISFIEMLLNQYSGALNDHQSDYCKGIHDASQRLLVLINDIIDFVSIEAGKLTLQREKIDLDSFISNLLILVFNRCQDQGLKMTAYNETSLSHFQGDERRLRQALFNGLINAIKFTPSGGKIDLIVREQEDEGKRFLSFTIKDTGVGIKPDDLEKILHFLENPPSSPHRHYAGTGLGLSLVKSFITLHGGSVTLISPPHQGTTITCSIPLDFMEN